MNGDNGSGAARSRVKGLALSGLFVALITAGAYIKIDFTFVNFTLQFLFADMAALMLGRKYGTLACGVYILLGLVGVPVFSAGMAGIGYLMKPSFGFIIGFLAGGFAASTFVHLSKKESFWIYMAASLINLAIVYAVGLGYGYVIIFLINKTAMSAKAFFMAFLIPFIPFDLIKCVLAAFLAQRLAKIIKHNISY